MSQPAMSRALGRIRKLLGDRILVRGSNGLVPTSKAIALQPRLKQLLAEIEELLSDVPFDPASLQGAIALSGTDYQMNAILPRLFARISAEAPQLEVKVVPLFNLTPEDLHKGTVDLVFGTWQENLSPSLRQEELDRDRYVTLMRQDIRQNRLSDEEFAARSHILVSALGDRGSAIDTILENRGLKRRIALQVPNFLTAMQLAAQSDLLLTLPSQIAASYTQFNLVAVECEITSQPIQNACIWSEVMNRDPVVSWLRALAREEAGLVR